MSLSLSSRSLYRPQQRDDTQLLQDAVYLSQLNQCTAEYYTLIRLVYVLSTCLSCAIGHKAVLT